MKLIKAFNTQISHTQPICNIRMISKCSKYIVREFYDRKGGRLSNET